MAEAPKSKYQVPFIGDTLKIIASPSLWSKELGQQGEVVQAYAYGLNGLQSLSLYHLSGVEALTEFYNNENILRKNVHVPSDLYPFNQQISKDGAEQIRTAILMKATHSPEHINHFLEMSSSLVDAFIIEMKARAPNGRPAEIEFNTSFRHLCARFIAKFHFSYDADVDWINNHYELMEEITSSSFKINTYFSQAESQRLSKWFCEWTLKQITKHRAHPERYEDTMKRLIKAEPALNNQEIMHMMVHLLFASNSITSAVSGAMISLLREKDVSLKVMDEINSQASLLKTMVPRFLTDEYLQIHLPYLGKVIKEALRVWPVVPLQFGVATEDTIIRGYRIQKGAGIVAGIWATGFDPRLHENPEVFRPERYDEEITVNGGFDWSSFGGGELTKSHRCTGESTVLNVCTYFIARILLEFDFKLINPNQTFMYDINTPRPVDELPMFIKVKPQKKYTIEWSFVDIF